ncbi:MAG: hypothetical protein ACT4OX_01670 [Actinomycetota bacterium]
MVGGRTLAATRLTFSQRYDALARWYANRQTAVLPRDIFEESESRIARDRARIFTLLRLGGRAFSLAHAGNQVSNPRLFRAVVALSAIGDVIEGVTIHRAQRGYVHLRAGRDLAETVTHAAVGANLPGVSVSAAPLLIELSFRIGSPSAALAALHVGAAAVARRARRRDLRLDDLAFLGVALAGGLGLRRVESARVNMTFDRMRQAREDAGDLDARSSGRMRAFYKRPDGPAAEFPSYHEALFTAASIGCDKHVLPEDSALRRVLENRRPQLVAGEAAYLADALRQWADVNRRVHTTVSRQVADVVFERESFQTVLLTRNQLASLRNSCERKKLAGDIAVTDVLHGILGDAVALTVTEVAAGETKRHVIRLPADRPSPWYGLSDAVPAGMTLGTIWAATQATRAADGFAIATALPGIGAFGTATILSQLMARYLPHEHAHPWSADAAILSAAVQLLAIARRSSAPDRPDGYPRLPVQNALLCPAMVLGYVWPTLTQRSRIRLGVEVAAVCCAGIALMKSPRPWKHLFVNLACGPAVGFVGGRLYRSSVASDADRVETRMLEEARRDFDIPALEEEAAEWRLIARAAGEALDHLKPRSDEREFKYLFDVIAHVELRARQFSDDAASTQRQ